MELMCFGPMNPSYILRWSCFWICGIPPTGYPSLPASTTGSKDWHHNRYQRPCVYSREHSPLRVDVPRGSNALPARTRTDFPVEEENIYLVNCSLEKIDQAQQDSMQTEEDVVRTDGVDSLWVPLQKLLLQEKTSTNQATQSVYKTLICIYLHQCS